MPSKINLTQEQVNDIISYYENHSLAETAKEFNFSSYFIEKTLKSQDIHIRNYAEEQFRTNPVNNDEVLASFNDIGFSKTCRKFSIGEKRCKAILATFGITDVSRKHGEINEDEICKDLFERGIGYTTSKHHVSRDFVYGLADKYNLGRPDIDAIRKATNLRVHGDANYCNKEKVKESWNLKSKQEKEAILEKIKQTCEERYGDPYYRNYEKSKQTRLDRYGDENYRNSEKLSKTHKDKTREELEDIKQRTSNTCMEKYGVPWACMRDEARYKGNNSKPNQIFASILEDNNIEYEREFPIITKDGRSYSYDFKVGNNLIEINPFSTHNSTWCIFDREPLDKNYHINKSKAAKEAGYRCIMVWDWDNIDNIISLLKERPKVYARSCTIGIIDKDTAKEFTNKNHIQGHAKADIYLGLFYNEELISLMSFGKPRYNKNYEYELVRYCSTYNVTGGVERLFKYFINGWNPSSIISYCDLSKFNGHTYEKLGFMLKNNPAPSRHWYNEKNNRPHITDNMLRQRGFDQLFGTSYGKGTSNTELMIDNGYVEIYDCGQATYIWLAVL